jgi:hypothetical protein
MTVQTATRDSVYKYALVAVFFLTILCLAVEVSLDLLVDHMNADQASLAQSMDKAFWAGFGALVGLIGGKVT